MNQDQQNKSGEVSQPEAMASHQAPVHGGREKKPISGGLIAAIVSCIVVVLAIIGLIIFLPKLSGVSKQDRQNASQKISDIGAEYRTLEKTTGECTNKIDKNEILSCMNTAKEDFANFENRFKELGKEKAIEKTNGLMDKYHKAEGIFAEIKETFNLGIEYNRVLAPLIATALNDTFTSLSPSELTVSFHNTANEIRNTETNNDEIKKLRDNAAHTLDDMANAIAAQDSSAIFAATEEFENTFREVQSKVEALDAKPLSDVLNEIDAELRK